MESGDLALVHGTWRSAGSDDRATLLGGYCSAVRRGGNGSRRIAVETIVLADPPGSIEGRRERRRGPAPR